MKIRKNQSLHKRIAMIVVEACANGAYDGWAGRETNEKVISKLVKKAIKAYNKGK